MFVGDAVVVGLGEPLGVGVGDGVGRGGLSVASMRATVIVARA